MRRWLPRRKLRTIDFLVALSQRLKNEIPYVVLLEPGVQTCAQTLSLGTGSSRDIAFSMTAYEAVFYYLWKQRKLPLNVDPLDSKLEVPSSGPAWRAWFRIWLAERGRLCSPTSPHSHPFRQPPLDQSAMVSGSEKLFLVPGDSSLGYHLLLDSLPWTKPEYVNWS